MMLVCLTPILTELYSANMGPSEIFNPLNFFVLGVAAYGIPVLLIRELAIRSGTGLTGLFIMGLGYALFNEGVIAKTILMTPAQFNYTAESKEFTGVNWKWAAVILPWHAFHAVIFPIALLALLFPKRGLEPWLKEMHPGWIALMLIGPVCFSTIFHFVDLLPAALFAAGVVLRDTGLMQEAALTDPGRVNSPSYFLPLFWGILLLAVYLGARLKAGAQTEGAFFTPYHGKLNFSQAGLGMLFFIVVIVISFILRQQKEITVWWQVAYTFTSAGLFWAVLGGLNWRPAKAVAVFALGNYTIGSAFTVMIHRDLDHWDKVISGMVLGGIIVAVLFWFVLHRSRNAGASTIKG